MLTNKLTGAGAADKTYIEDVFSTYLYTGNGSTQTINNGIDIAGKGGMVWLKSRSAATNNFLFDTSRGVLNEINSNTTDAQSSLTNSLTAFNSDGFNLGSAAGINVNAATYASWTFRKAPKFFDVVTWTGNGVNNRQISHNLGQIPGMIIFKCTSSTSGWATYHTSTGVGKYLQLQTTTSVSTSTNAFPSVTSTTFTPTADTTSFIGNDNGATYVAYLFAHDTSTDGLIQCGGYTGNGSTTGPTINLGWEPQYIMIKNSSSTGNWQIIDNMRGMPVGSADATLQANLSSTESSAEYVSPTATGFQVTSTSSEVNQNTFEYIYMAIRRGPMRTPTDATKVFQPIARSGTGSTATISTTSVNPDAFLAKVRTSGNWWNIYDRLRGVGKVLYTNDAYSQTTDSTGVQQLNNNNVVIGISSDINSSGYTIINYIFSRAPGFFDVVCYTGTGAVRTVNHNLEVAPELMLVKRRDLSMDWAVYNNSIGNTQGLMLNGDFGAGGSAAWNSTSPTKSVFTVSGVNEVNTSGYNYVAYLFASCPGVSKVGSFTGNGSSQTINCGFAAGARFVLIKRTDSTGGNWYVWDTARGIVAGNDPHLSLNSDAAEVTTNDTIDPDSTGFIVNQVAATNVNVSGGSYIYLAIA